MLSPSLRQKTGSSQPLDPQSPWRAKLQGCLCKNRWNSQSNGSQKNQNLSLQCIANQVRMSHQIPAMIQAKSIMPKYNLNSCIGLFGSCTSVDSFTARWHAYMSFFQSESVRYFNSSYTPFKMWRYIYISINYRHLWVDVYIRWCVHPSLCNNIHPIEKPFWHFI